MQFSLAVALATVCYACHTHTAVWTAKDIIVVNDVILAYYDDIPNSDKGIPCLPAWVSHAYHC